jgi:hypothetical protein
MSDVLIAWGKAPLFWVVVLVVVGISASVIDHQQGWGVLASVGGFLAQIADIVKSAVAGMV